MATTVGTASSNPSTPTPGPSPGTDSGPGSGDGSGLDSRRAWLMVAAAFASMFTVFGVAYSFGAFFKPMAEEFQSGRSATSAVFSITAFLYFILGAVSGVATDRFGPRRVLLLGAAVMGAGLLLTSQVDRLWLGYVTYGLGVGIGVACGYVPMVAVVGGWFVRRRSTALGVAVAGIGLGTLLVAPIARAMIEAYGWRTTYVVLGIASAVVLGACAMVIAPAPVQKMVSSVSLRDKVRTPFFLWLYLSVFLMGLALFDVFVYVAPYAEDRGIGGVAAASLVGLVGGASVAGRLSLGFLADRFGTLRVFQGCTFVMGASFGVWAFARSYWSLAAFAAVLGVAYGGWIALAPAVVAERFGVAGLGGATGALYTGAAFGGLLGPPLGGLLIDGVGYRWMILVAMAFGLASSLALLPVKRYRVETPQ